jgi:endonuclease-8
VPEGDTIWRVAAALRARIAGAIVRRSSHTGLEGRRVEAVEAVGKHLLIRFEGGYVLHTHLGMYGSWYVLRPRERWRKPSWQARAVLETDEWVAVCFLAPTVKITRDAEIATHHLGPDLLRDEFELDVAVRRARALGAEVPLGELLLDQRVAAGIGNVYRCETLWTGKPCPRCGTRIDSRRQGALARWTYFCPRCQDLG